MTLKNAILDLKAKGLSSSEITKELTERKMLTPRGKKVTAANVRNYLHRYRTTHKPHHAVIPKALQPKRKYKAEDMVLNSELSDKEKIRLLKALRKGSL